MTGCVKASTFTIPLSFVARIINKIPTGKRTKEASQPPKKGEIVFDSAIFFPKVEMKK